MHGDRAWADGYAAYPLLTTIRSRERGLLPKEGGVRNPLTLGTQKGFRGRVRPSTQKGFRKETPSSAPKRVSEERATSSREGPSVGGNGRVLAAKETHASRRPALGLAATRWSLDSAARRRVCVCVCGAVRSSAQFCTVLLGSSQQFAPPQLLGVDHAHPQHARA